MDKNLGLNRPVRLDSCRIMRTVVFVVAKTLTENSGKFRKIGSGSDGNPNQIFADLWSAVILVTLPLSPATLVNAGQMC